MTRNKRLNIKLSPGERRALEILAAREGRTLSELTRELLSYALVARLEKLTLKELVEKLDTNAR